MSTESPIDTNIKSFLTLFGIDNNNTNINDATHLDKLLKRQMNNQLLIRITLHPQPRITNKQIRKRVRIIFISGIAHWFIEHVTKIDETFAIFGWCWFGTGATRGTTVGCG